MAAMTTKRNVFSIQLNDDEITFKAIRMRSTLSFSSTTLAQKKKGNDLCAKTIEPWTRSLRILNLVLVVLQRHLEAHVESIPVP